MVEKISVIIITRNRAEMLLRCLSSLVLQTLTPNEIIVVDNASEDDTKKVILIFKKKLPIKYVYEQKIGIPYARNRGIQETSGTLILMLDDDCEAEKSWVEKMVDAHKKYPGAWVIQGRTYSLPPEKSYSLLSEFNNFFYLHNNRKTKFSLKMQNFFDKNFAEEMEILMCDTKNFSIKTSSLKKYRLFFDERFYRGSDTDLGKQIIQKNGLIMYCPDVKVYHWERSSLKAFLEQRWQIGRTSARIADKWVTSFSINLPRPKLLLALLIYCKSLNQWHNFPMLLCLLYLDRLYRINGFSYEKRVLSLERKRSEQNK